MNALVKAKDALLEACEPIMLNSMMIVPTPWTFPDGDPVKVYVQPHDDLVTLSDGGDTIRQLLFWGGEPDQFRRAFSRKAKSRNLKMTDTMHLVTEAIPVTSVPAWIAILAEAAHDFANWLLEKHKSSASMDLHREMDVQLEAHFRSRLRRNFPLPGASGKIHKFDWAIVGKRKVILDAVTPDGNAVNATFSRHMDLRLSGPDDVINRIIYRRDDPWKTEDLNLLQEATQLISHENAIEVVKSLAA